ncbi:MAG: hypothetical protein GY718_14460 [Lentisphaerae bacterium]|nr:hypothetical protein [Lentisphaerota bacterium]
MERKYFDYDQNHPERMEDEMFLGNFDAKGFDSVGWQPKRKGTKAYMANNITVFPYQKEHGIFPAFVKKWEVEKAGSI